MDEKQEKRFLLILDLDGTLIPEDADEKTQFKVRPGWNELLNTCQQQNIDLAIWSAGSHARIQHVLQDPLFKQVTWQFVWDSRRCTWQHPVSCGYFNDNFYLIPRKRLSKVWRRKSTRKWTRATTLILDNTPSTYSYNYGNALPISTWKGSDDDKELFRIATWLQKLGENKNADVRFFGR